MFEPDDKHQLELNVTYTGQRSLDYRGKHLIVNRMTILNVTTVR